MSVIFPQTIQQLHYITEKVVWKSVLSLGVKLPINECGQTIVYETYTTPEVSVTLTPLLIQTISNKWNDNQQVGIVMAITTIRDVGP